MVHGSEGWEKSTVSALRQWQNKAIKANKYMLVWDKAGLTVNYYEFMEQVINIT